MEIWLFSKTKIQVVDNVEALPSAGFVWIDADQEEVQQVVDKIFAVTGVCVNEEHIQDCQNLQHPSFYEATRAYDILIFRSLAADCSPNGMETAPVSVLVLPKLIVTFNHHDAAIGRVKKRLLTTSKKLPVDPQSLLFVILDEVIDNFLLLKQPLMEEYNYWELELFEGTSRSVNWLKFLDFKTSVRKLRILSEEQQEVMYQWRQDNEAGANEHLTIRYNDLKDHVRRIIRYATQVESDLDNLIQLHYSLIGNRTNETMRILTVLSAIFLPLNLIAGIFGMNFVHMKVFNYYYAQDITLWGMLVLAIGLYWLFKWKEWI
jgi:magnesium transporter